MKREGVWCVLGGHLGESARGLAQSKTLARVRMRRGGMVLGVAARRR